MTYHFDFDPEHRVLRGRVEGVVTDEQLMEFYDLSAQQVARTSPLAGVIDFSAVADLSVSAQTIRNLAKRAPAMPDPEKLRFIVAPAPSIFGLARMFQVEGEQTRPSLHVVRTMREVCEIIGVPKLHFEPLPPEQSPLPPQKPREIRK